MLEKTSPITEYPKFVHSIPLKPEPIADAPEFKARLVDNTVPFEVDATWVSKTGTSDMEKSNAVPNRINQKMTSVGLKEKCDRKIIQQAAISKPDIAQRFGPILSPIQVARRVPNSVPTPIKAKMTLIDVSFI